MQNDHPISANKGFKNDKHDTKLTLLSYNVSQDSHFFLKLTLFKKSAIYVSALTLLTLQRNVKFRQKSQDILQKSCSYTIEIVSLP